MGLPGAPQTRYDSKGRQYFMKNTFSGPAGLPGAPGPAGREGKRGPRGKRGRSGRAANRGAKG